jgi:hypothetical protein
MDSVDSVGLGFIGNDTEKKKKKDTDPNDSLATADMSTLLSSFVQDGDDPINSAAEVQNATYDPTATSDPYSAVNDVKAKTPDLKMSDVKKMHPTNPYFDASYAGRMSRFYHPAETPTTQDPYSPNKP